MLNKTNIIDKLPTSPEIKEKVKKIIPIVAIIIVLLIIIKLIFSAGNNGKSVNKDAIKLLQKQNPKKVISVMPDGFAEDVIDYYDHNVKDEKQLRDAIKAKELFSKFQEIDVKNVKKVKIIENIDIDASNIPDAPLDMHEEAVVKGMISSINSIYHKTIHDDAVLSIAEITYKDEDGEKQTEDYLLLSVKIGKKWYSANCMQSVIQSAWDYDAKMASRKNK